MQQDKNYSIYKLTSPDNKVYIGCTSQNPKDRWDYGNKYHHNKELTDDIRLFGWDDFEHEILYSDLPEEKAYELERDLIREYNSCDPKCGYNKTRGGKINPGIIRSADYRKHLSDRMAGENHPFYGKHLSDEHRQRISESNRGHVVSEETRRKIGEANRGRIKNEETIRKWRKSHEGYAHSEETRRKIGEANRGKVISEDTRRKIGEANRGRIASEELRRKMSDSSSNKRRVICVETGVIYDSMREAAASVNTPRSNIGSVCTGKTKTAGGYHWTYVD